MAKKKNPPSINLLKGITGSKLAALITVLIILFAIPLTINMTREQQTLKQEAAVDATTACKNIDGTCMTTNTCNSSRYWNGKYCNSYQGATGIYCCLPKIRCSSVGGSCVKNTATRYCSISISSGQCSTGYICCKNGSYLPR